MFEVAERRHHHSRKASPHDLRQCKLRGHLGKALWECLKLLPLPTTTATTTRSIVHKERERWRDSLSPFARPMGRMIYRTPALHSSFPGISSFFKEFKELERDSFRDHVRGQGKGHISLQPLNQLTSRCTKSWRSIDLHDSLVRLSYIPSPCHKIHFPHRVTLRRV